MLIRLPALVLALAATVVLGVGFAGCGKSADEKAKDNACNAIGSIKTQVNEVQGYTANTITKAKVQENVARIRDDLSELKKTYPDLKANFKSQVQSATTAFTQSLTAVAKSIPKGTSVADARQQIVKAADQLAASYAKTLGSVPC